jgi:hypothetical protein
MPLATPPQPQPLEDRPSAPLRGARAERWNISTRTLTALLIPFFFSTLSSLPPLPGAPQRGIVWPTSKCKGTRRSTGSRPTTPTSRTLRAMRRLVSWRELWTVITGQVR